MRSAPKSPTVLRNAIAHAGYTNAGTVEFLMDETGKLYFIEVNARVQVEHPVTEFVTGIDIVKSQIRIAQGETLAEILPGPVELRGHSIECRINAENPETFVPSPGRITGFHLPGGIGVRVDTWAYTDCVIPPFYDSLVAKLITYGSDRAEAIRRMQRALSMFIVEGIHTSIPMQQRILADPDFQAGQLRHEFHQAIHARPQMKRGPLAAASVVLRARPELAVAHRPLQLRRQPDGAFLSRVAIPASARPGLRAHLRLSQQRRLRWAKLSLHGARPVRSH